MLPTAARWGGEPGSPKPIVSAIAVGAAPAIVRAQAGGGPVIEQIKQRGTLRAGLSTFIPWAMRDKQGGLIGFELDVVRLEYIYMIGLQPL